jgi:sodium/hydrogen antiporter
VENVPLRIRHLLVAESASNDGMAYPFLSIAIYLTTEASRETAFEKWLVISWFCPWTIHAFLWLVLISLDARSSNLGYCLWHHYRYEACLSSNVLRQNGPTGYLVSRVMRFAQLKGFVDRESYIAQYIALALFTTGAINSLGNDDLLAAFAAGVFLPHHNVFFCSFLRVGSAISWDDNFNIQTKGDAFSPVLDLVLNCICFIYIGAWLPFDQFDISELGISPWRLVLLVLVIIALRRIPCLLILYKWLPEVSNWREALFCGHFGPVSSLRSGSCLVLV